MQAALLSKPQLLYLCLQQFACGVKYRISVVATLCMICVIVPIIFELCCGTVPACECAVRQTVFSWLRKHGSAKLKQMSWGRCHEVSK